MCTHFVFKWYLNLNQLIQIRSEKKNKNNFHNKNKVTSF